jgi:hypothetical protein
MTNVAFTDIYPDGPGTLAAGGIAGAGQEFNPDYPGMPVGAVPMHRDFVATAAGTYDLWTPPAGYRWVLANASVAASAGGRVALVDNADVAGARIEDADLAANGGALPNFVPVPWPSLTAGNVLRLVTTVAGNTRVRVSGWQVQA